MSAGALLGIAVCALCAAVLGAVVKKSNKEYALLLAAGAVVLIVVSVLKNLGPLTEQLARLAGEGGAQKLCLDAMLKAVGLTVLGQLAVQLCKDAGEAALAYGVELAAKVAVLTVAMPVITQLFEYLGEILKL